MTKKEKVTWDHMLETMESYKEKNHKLELKVAEYEKGASQVNKIVDAIMVEVAKKYGEPVYEDDEIKAPVASKLIGYRMVFPVPDLDNREIIKVEKNDISRTFTVGVFVGEQDD